MRIFNERSMGKLTLAFDQTASSAERIEARYINGSNGLTIYGPVQMVAGQGNNKWSAVNKYKIG